MCLLTSANSSFATVLTQRNSVPPDVGAMANPTLHTLQPWSGVSVVPSGPVAMTTRPEYSYQQGWVPTMGFGYFSGNGIPELRRASLETRTYEPASSTTASEPEDGMGCRGVSPDAGTNTDMYSEYGRRGQTTVECCIASNNNISTNNLYP